MIPEKVSSNDESLLALCDEMVRLALVMERPANDVPCDRCAAGMPCYWCRPLHGSKPR